MGSGAARDTETPPGGLPDGVERTIAPGSVPGGGTRRFGTMPGAVTMLDGFDDPLTIDEITLGQPVMVTRGRAPRRGAR